MPATGHRAPSRATQRPRAVRRPARRPGPAGAMTRVPTPPPWRRLWRWFNYGARPRGRWRLCRAAMRAVLDRARLRHASMMPGRGRLPGLTSGAHPPATVLRKWVVLCVADNQTRLRPDVGQPGTRVHVTVTRWWWTVTGAVPGHRVRGRRDVPTRARWSRWRGRPGRAHVTVAGWRRPPSGSGAQTGALRAPARTHTSHSGPSEETW